MALTLEDLWKAADDDKILEAIGRWDSTNEEGQRTLAAEVERRGLKVVVPEISARPASKADAAPGSFTGKAMFLVLGVLACIFALATLVP